MHTTIAYDRSIRALAVAAPLLLLVVPLFAVHAMQAANPGLHAGSEEVTVGIAVILRATLRRFLRTTSNQFLRTTFGVVGRATARAATRRVVKAATKVAIGKALSQSDGDAEVTAGKAPQPAWKALLLGTLALAASMFVILQLVPDTVVRQLLGDGSIHAYVACLLVALPLPAYAALHALFCRVFPVRITYRTDLEGILLQGYFTGSGSFLPMATDIEYSGDARPCGLLAACCLLGMLALHLCCLGIARATGSPALELLAGALLVYVFVYAFPIQPLEGALVWRLHKGLWLLVATPILACFLWFLPVSLGEIL